MTIRDKYIELKKLGFKPATIVKHTGITKTKLNNLEFIGIAKFTKPQEAAFEAYYQHAKTLSRVYGEKLAEYLAENEK